jgi:hypothetical protein
MTRRNVKTTPFRRFELVPSDSAYVSDLEAPCHDSTALLALAAVSLWEGG